MIPEKDSFMLFKRFESMQERLDNHIGLVIKKNQRDLNHYAQQFREAITKLSKHYKPHVMKHQNYWRWSFAIPFDLLGDYYKGNNLVVEWHNDTPNKIEYLTIRLHPKEWHKTRKPPCLWN